MPVLLAAAQEVAAEAGVSAMPTFQVYLVRSPPFVLHGTLGLLQLHTLGCGGHAL
jgi:hypothetical protein